MNSVLQSAGVGLKDPVLGIGWPSSLLHDVDSKQEGRDCVEPFAIQRSSISHRALESKSWPTSRVATSLELSENYFPEAYTVDSQIPRSCLVTISSFEQSRTCDSITNVYKVLYLASYRRWRWLSLAIEIPSSSMYQATTRTTQQSHGRGWDIPMISSARLLPYSLLKKLQGSFCEAQEVHDNSTVCLSLSEGDIMKPPRLLPPSASILTSTPTGSTALAGLHDLGCDRFDEEDVIQHEMVDPPSTFYSSLIGSGKPVYEIKSIGSEPSPGMLYNIRVLHCMRGTAGCSRLIGIVTDHSQTYLKSYLIDVPRARWNLIHAAGDTSISWERREKWAYQLVHGIRRIHAQGFTIGSLPLMTMPVIDDTDSVRFWSFKERFVTGRTIGGYYPPEFRYVRNMSQTTIQSDSPKVTSKTDIFHMGTLLWLLAENKLQTRSSPVCGRMKCGAHGEDGVTFDLSHMEPIALPVLADSVPQYFQNIVDACRAEDPRERPAARAILQMFPFPITPASYNQGFEHQTQPNMETVTKAMRIGSVTCTHCHTKAILMPFYSCNVCRSADFDMCQRCYDRGMHCSDNSHLLAETGKIGSWVVVQRYHSCVNKSGVRDVTVL